MLRRVALALTVVLALPLVLSIGYAFVPPPVSAVMLWNLIEGRGIDYRWRPLAEISPELARAVITAEDARFCSHAGIDWSAVQDALEIAFDNEERPSRGASTIAMQTAKNLFLWEGRSVVRKAIEAPIALWIDVLWTKKRVIEVYLNIAEWGPGTYGAEAAARRHFQKSAKNLTRREAALLASVLPNPITRNAAKPSRHVRRKAGVIAARAAGMDGFLDCIG